MGDSVVVGSGQLSQARNEGIVIHDGHSNDIRVAKEKEKSGGKCKGKEKVTSTSTGRENAIQVEEDVSSGYESALSIGQQGSGRQMERGEPSTRNEDRRVRKKTYNCPSIEECFRQGHKTRPKTKQELTNSLLTPNNLLKNIIDSLLMMSPLLLDQKSSAKTLRQLPKQYPPFQDLFGNEAISKLLEPLDVPGNACPDLNLQLDINTTVFNNLISNLLKSIIDSLLDNMMSSSLSDQKSSAKTLRQITEQYPPFQDLFGNDAVSNDACLDLHLQGDIITTVYNISLPQGNKKVVAENPRVIPLLTNALRTGASKTQSNAVAALIKLSELDSNRTLIHESGALEPLISLVRDGNSETMTNVCEAMNMLCRDGDNTNAHREKPVSDGAVRVILRKVKDGDFLDLLLPVLATLSNLPSAAEEMGKMGDVACLHKIMESGDKDSNAVKSCAAILRNICSYDKDELKEVKQEEAANGTISRH